MCFVQTANKEYTMPKKKNNRKLYNTNELLQHINEKKNMKYKWNIIQKKTKL